MRFWHFSNNEEAREDDRIFKTRNLVIKIVDNFQKTLESDSMLVVDETMVPFRERLKFRQYSLGKAHKYSVQLFKLCGTNGYTYNIEVYVRKT